MRGHEPNGARDGGEPAARDRARGREAVARAGPLDALVVNHARSQLGTLGTLGTLDAEILDLT